MEKMDGKDIEANDQLIDPLVKKFSKELSSGTSALVLLCILNHAETPLYGYQIARLLGHHNTDKQGAIYPILRNMEAKGLLTSQMQASESGPPRKYFKISMLGKNVLKEWLTVWHRTQSFVNQAIAGQSKGEEDVK
jgi:PadR family transcriptional regulator, regulatory protein PadR